MIELAVSFLEHLKKLGIEVIFFVAGVGGAIVSMRQSKGLKWYDWILNMLVGGIVATYLTPVVSDVVKINASAILFIAFVTGFMGYKSAEWAVEWMKKKLNKKD